MSKPVWNPDNIRDIAESVGIASLGDDVVNNLSRDVEFRLSQVLDVALKFMRHSGRTVLATSDISHSLRVLSEEPLYGYESTRSLRFGEASIGPGQPLFYVEDEEMDFERLINQALPKVPRDTMFTAHWLAIEGVQPSIPQNPTSAESRSQELLPKGLGANPHLSALSGNDNVSVKPLVKHVLSKELQMYFERVCAAILDENSDEYRDAAFSSLRNDPGLQQLIPYFVNYASEKITHSLSNVFVLHQVLRLIGALLENHNIFLDPYVVSLVPTILTTLISHRLGPNPPFPKTLDELTALRVLSASLLSALLKRYSKTSLTLEPRMIRTLLRVTLDPLQSYSSHFGAIIGLVTVGGSRVVRELLIPNLELYSEIIKEGVEGEVTTRSGLGNTKRDAQLVVEAVINAFRKLIDDKASLQKVDYESPLEEEEVQKLRIAVGQFFADRVIRDNTVAMTRVMLQKLAI
ncbi:MAG: hypothetical protein M1814_001661 [Vezdaea aestivalis]|nr:MAG: hypothetical protein M1814_001661 [Vezdaea aestivalis]